MLEKRKYHLISVLILYFFFIINLIALNIIQVSLDNTFFRFVYSVSITMIYLFIPVTAILSLVYLMKFKKDRLLNFAVLVLSFIPVTSILLFLYVLADKLSQF